MSMTHLREATMSDFVFGFLCGVVAAYGASLAFSFGTFLFMNWMCRDEDYPEEQPYIRLTKVMSEHVKEMKA